MAKPSAAQAKIIDQIKAGNRLSLDTKSGRYVLSSFDGKVRDVDQRPVITMIRDGLLQQDMSGHCHIA